MERRLSFSCGLSPTIFPQTKAFAKRILLNPTKEDIQKTILLAEKAAICPTLPP